MSFKNKILSQSDTKQKVADWKSKGKKVVFTNGCFDILHRGHIEYLYAASKKGDHLVIGLNTDKSVKRLKGSNRPINDEESRAILLAALEFVDTVVLFGEDTPLELISSIIPNTLVKGADYEAKDIVGYDVVTENGGTVETIELVEGFSTSNIVNKLNN